MICKIKMNTENDVVKVSEVAAKTGIDMSVSCGNDMIDPRSLLGLFNFIGKEAVLVAPDDMDHRYFQKVVKRMGVAV